METVKINCRYDICSDALERAIDDFFESGISEFEYDGKSYQITNEVKIGKVTVGAEYDARGDFVDVAATINYVRVKQLDIEEPWKSYTELADAVGRTGCRAYARFLGRNGRDTVEARREFWEKWKRNA